MLNEQYDICRDDERELENQERSSYCMKDGVYYHRECHDWSCECDCHDDDEF